jgi:cytochrome c553
MRRVVFVMIASGCFLAGPRMRPASTEVVERTSARVERGRYLVENVCACLYCHSQHDWSTYTGMVVPGTRGGGGVCLTKEHDVDGHVCTQNLTPHADGLKSWSDGEIMRAMREGVSRDGRALLPWMPYKYYRSMSDEDARAVVAYLRTLPEVPGRHDGSLDFPINVLMNTAPEPLEGPVSAPSDAGGYLVQLAACDFCHTRQPRGQRDVGRDFAGGFALVGPWGRVVTPNITPHPTGLGRYSKDEFIARIHSWADFDESSAPRQKSGSTVMPWKYYAGLTDEDLGLIYDWLMKQKPIENVVSPFEP